MDYPLVVIGGSAGAFEEMRTLMLRLPADLEAAVVLCLHTRAREGPRLAEVLGLRAPLPVTFAEDGAWLEPSHAYVAPGNHHVFVRDGRLWLSTGPTENYARPSIDVLFRSAAIAARERCVGVLLSGLNEDGALGLAAVARCGGAALVQSPESARYERMPAAGLRLVPDALVAETWSLAEHIVERARTRPGASVAECPRELVVEGDLAFYAGRPRAGLADAPPSHDGALGACPECGGPVFDVAVGAPHYRCRMGHAYSQRAFLSAHRRELVRALWAAERSLQERARMLERLSVHDRSDEYAQHARALHALLEAIVTTADGETEDLEIPAELDEAR